MTSVMYNTHFCQEPLQIKNKSHWTNKLQSRYQSVEPHIYVNSPQAVIVDAMFIINTTPL